MTMIRIGHGYDVHRLAEGRDLIIGGVKIPHDAGLLGHSDADVLAHALMDALLGAAGLGDIGRHFPDKDVLYKGADSIRLLEECVGKVRAKGYGIGNVDCTIVAQAPKLKEYMDDMQQILAEACGVEIDRVNVKATTEERLGFTGRKQGIAAHAVVLIESVEK